MLLNKLLALSLLLTVFDLTSCQFWQFPYNYESRICRYGHRLIGGNCEPICKPNCQANSRCTGVNECTCDNGYFSSQSITDETTGSNIELCLPICNAGCPANSECYAPEKCRCTKGYTPLTDEDGQMSNTGECIPECVDQCPQHASCVRPNDCVCAIGYEMSAHGVCERTIPTTDDTITSEIETTTGISFTTEMTTIGTTDDTTTSEIETTTGITSTTEMTTIETTDDTTTSDIETTTGISSTTESIEFFNHTAEVEVLTEVSAGDEKGNFLQPNDLGKCAGLCSCWKVHPRDQCHVICESTETRCLEPQFTRCIEPSKRIEYSVSDVTKIYTCYTESVMSTSKTPSSAWPLPTIVVGLLFTAIMLVLFVYYRHRSRKISYVITTNSNGIKNK